jgi:hypothetical protein
MWSIEITAVAEATPPIKKAFPISAGTVSANPLEANVKLVL